MFPILLTPEAHTSATGVFCSRTQGHCGRFIKPDAKELKHSATEFRVNYSLNLPFEIACIKVLEYQT